jgi:Uma2 family endonuclease
MDIRPLNYDVPKDTSVDEDGRVRLTNAFMERLAQTDLLPPSARWELLRGEIYGLRYERYPGHPELKLDIREDEDGRVLFTNRAMEQLVEAGLIDEEERWELLRGEWFDMPSEGALHYHLRAMLLRVFVREVPDAWVVTTEGSIFLDDDLEVRPDLAIHPLSISPRSLKGRDMALAVEVMVSSHRRDLDRKLPIYADTGVPEVWMIDAKADLIHAYTNPDGSTFQDHRQFGADEPVSPASFPEISVRLADLKP